MTSDELVIKELEPYLHEFKKHMISEQGQEWDKERVDRKEWFQKELAKKTILDLEEHTLGMIIESLWANVIWSDKSYLINNILNNGLDKIKENLSKLLHGNAPISNRFNDFRNEIKHIGPSMITEMLAFVHPDEYPIWNAQTRNALRILGIHGSLPDRVFKYQINGSDYEQCIIILKSLRELLQRNGFPDMDYIELDFFLAFIAFEYKTPEVIEEEKMVDFDHDEVCDLIMAIGTNLGFSVQPKKKIAIGAVLDVYWSARVGNMGEIAYAFEVQKHGSIDSAILNLQRARNDPKVQRVVFVAKEEEINSIREEMASVPGDFKRYISYLDVRDVFRSAELLTEVNEILRELRLVPSKE